MSFGDPKRSNSKQNPNYKTISCTGWKWSLLPFRLFFKILLRIFLHKTGNPQTPPSVWKEHSWTMCRFIVQVYAVNAIWICGAFFVPKETKLLLPCQCKLYVRVFSLCTIEKIFVNDFNVTVLFSLGSTNILSVVTWKDH